MKYCKSCGQIFDSDNTKCETCKETLETLEGVLNEDMKLFKDTDVDKKNDIRYALLYAYNSAVGKVAKAETKLADLIAARDHAGKILFEYWQQCNE